MKRPRRSLAAELSRLAKIYSAEEWRSVAQLLEAESTRTSMAAISRRYAEGGDTKRLRGVRPRGVGVSLPGSNTRKDLELCSTEELRTLAVSAGLPISRKDSRERLIRKLWNWRAHGGNATSKHVSTSPESSRDYSRWVDIILRDSKK